MQQYKTKVEIIYDLLIEAISNGRYKQGDRMVISTIAKEYSTSEIPVREAIRRLESEGYVTVVPNHGPVVTGFSKDKLKSVFHIKAVLEGYATRLAVDYLTPEDIAGLRELNRQIADEVAMGESANYSALNMKFHLAIYKSIPLDTFYDTITDLWQKWGMTKCVFSMVPKRIPTSIDEHEQILRLIEEKEYDAVEAYVRRHKFDAWKDLVQVLEERGNI